MKCNTEISQPIDRTVRSIWMVQSPIDITISSGEPITVYSVDPPIYVNHLSVQTAYLIPCLDAHVCHDQQNIIGYNTLRDALYLHRVK